MTNKKIILRKQHAEKNIIETEPTNSSHPSSTDLIDVKRKLTIADRTNEPKPEENFGTEFLDNFAHQLVAPLQAIERHCAGIIKGRVVGDEIDTRLKEVVGHTRILTELARRMRFLHQLVSGAKIGFENITFSTITTTWIDGFNNYLPLMKDNCIEVEIKSDKMNNLPDVYASRLVAHQVIMNLYDNALKYGLESTKIIVDAKRVDDEIVNTFQHVAKIKLTNHAASQMFNRGFRADEAIAARAAGTGLGMYISRALMQSMDGDLVAYPTDGKNITKFELRWKVAR